MKNKLYAFSMILAVLALSSLAYAGVLDLDENNIIDGTYIIEDNTTYQIIYRTETYFNGDILKRFVVENSDKVADLQVSFVDTASNISSMKLYVMELSNKRDQLKPEIEKSKGVLDLLEAQFNSSNSQLTALQKRQDELKSMITSNVLMSESSYRIAVIVFIILLALVVIFKAKNIFMGGEPKKGKNKKGSLEIIAQEIKGNPNEITYGTSYDIKKPDDVV
ncbi:MAG: hypothetical protein NT129_06140 [Candidatus Aenigmarchaeota archaeon]|nr:hypothetical protein [Candidatus Aenigmarchaeota archaeon]